MYDKGINVILKVGKEGGGNWGKRGRERKCQLVYEGGGAGEQKEEGEMCKQITFQFDTVALHDPLVSIMTDLSEKQVFQRRAL